MQQLAVMHVFVYAKQDPTENELFKCPYGENEHAEFKVDKAADPTGRKPAAAKPTAALPDLREVHKILLG